MKEHIQRQMVNELRNIAIAYHSAEQLRDRILGCVNDYVRLNDEWYTHENVQLKRHLYKLAKSTLPEVILEEVRENIRRIVQVTRRLAVLAPFSEQAGDESDTVHQIANAALAAMLRVLNDER